MLPKIDFDSCFRALTDLSESETPFPWQQKLFEELVQGKFRATCDVPTGLGKTSVIAVWLLALAHHASLGKHPDFPRRLVYVVNRRTVVDQSTREAEHMRNALVNDLRLKSVKEALQTLQALESDNPLAISTLRGEMADNGEWSNDPTRPAVIVGTVDMIGSRLLFSGYGRGFKSRPLHAGFLGQDTLLVHDEAHLEPAFQELLEAITKEQERCKEFMKLRVMAMTATARSKEDSKDSLFTDSDRVHIEVKKRINAKKSLCFHHVDEKKIVDEIVNQALKYKNAGKAILIYARKLKDVIDVDNRLRKDGLTVQKLTGTLRGLERDNLAKNDEIFKRFMRKPENLSSDIEFQPGTVYLICTSAGEVGVNISGDHLVCDLAPFDSMVQRFGRVNRFGNEDSRIDLVCINSEEGNEAKKTDYDPEIIEHDKSNNKDAKNDIKSESKLKNPFDQACTKTLDLLQKLPEIHDNLYNASPAALNSLPASDRLAAFTPQPTIPSTSDILFDLWALTSVRQILPGRPAVADWLHGVAEWEPSETHVAWREEVSIVAGEMLEKYEPENLLEDYPLKPHELLRDRTDRIIKEIEKIAKRLQDLNAWIMQPDGKLEVISLGQLNTRIEREKPLEDFANCTVILPPEAGGLNRGFLQGDAEFNDAERYDVSDQWKDMDNNPMRCRIWDDKKSPDNMRQILVVDTKPEEDKDEDSENGTTRRFWCWYVNSSSADDDGSKIAKQQQYLDSHCRSAENIAGLIAAKINLNDHEAMAIKLAARWHDLGKNRKVWQHCIGNSEYPQKVLAKSGGRMRTIDLGRFRHEFGSLLDVLVLSEFKELEPEIKDLMLHLIAAHHGRARPHFPSEEAFDNNYSYEEVFNLTSEVPRRFARLQRKYGRWGLAYLESILRAADAHASRSVNLDIYQACNHDDQITVV